MKTIFSFGIIILLFFPVVSFSQQTANNQLIQTIYYYSFKAEMNAVATNNIEQEVKQLKGVIKVKIQFKPEKKVGELIVVVQEKKRSSEGDVLFQPVDLKRILATNGFIPNLLTTEITNN